MPRTLRQHVEEAMRILSCLGGPTILPSAANAIVRRRQRKRWRRNPKPQSVRPDIAAKRRDYAIDVKRICERLDRTGWAMEYLTASDDMAAEVWKAIPTHPVCPLCMERTPADRGKGRVYCKVCDTFVRPKILQGLVSADISKMREALIKGKIPCRAEKGEKE